MEMNELKQGEVLILTLTGELMGGEETKPFQERLYKGIREGLVNIVVDMNGIKWMNSSGLGIIMAGLTTLRSSEGDLRLANVSERVRRPIEVTKLDQVIQMYETVDKAVSSFGEGD